MSEKELLMPKYDASNIQQAGRISKKIENSANGHAFKIMNMYKASRRRRSTRRRTETYSSGPAVLGGERSCMEDNTIDKNGPQNSCVRGILSRLSKLIIYKFTIVGQQSQQSVSAFDCYSQCRAHIVGFQLSAVI